MVRPLAFGTRQSSIRASSHLLKLQAGTVVLTGSLSEILPAAKGDRFKAEFTPLGDVEVRFG